ncbi:hypothetical protein OKW26_002025 [Paraburkholderia sp. 32]
MNKSTTAENPAVEPAAMVRTLVRELSTIRDPGQALAFVLRSDESAPLGYVEAIAASGITGSQWTAEGGATDGQTSGLIRDEAGLQCIPTRAIALLKGGRWPGSGPQGRFIARRQCRPARACA